MEYLPYLFTSSVRVYLSSASGVVPNGLAGLPENGLVCHHSDDSELVQQGNLALLHTDVPRVEYDKLSE
jgi:hypothetical protein